MTPPPPRPSKGLANPQCERLLELLADQAVGALDAADAAELQRLLDAEPDCDPQTLERAAAALDLAFARDSLAVGPPLRLSAAAPAASPVTRTRPRWSGLKPWSGWVAAAAVLVAASAWLASPSSADASATLVKRCEKFRSRPGVIRTPCANWPDDAGTTRVSGVEGEVLWLDAENTGYMVLRNLPQNDSKKQQYQLWIFDQRDKARRICGAVFDSQGERTVVAITPHVRPRGGITAFGVTLEQAGGEVDSDMSNRVAIAKIER